MKLRKPHGRIVTIVAASALSGLALTACGGSDSASTAAAASDCTPAHKFSTGKEGVLTVAIVPSLPYIDQTDDGALTGVDGEFINAVAKLECLSVEPKVFGAAAAITAVQTGQADIAGGGWYNTEERGKVVGQSTPFYYDFTGIISKNGEITTVDGMLGKSVAVGAGSLFVKELQDLLGKDKVKQFQGADQNIQATLNGTTDFSILGSGEGGYLLSKVADKKGFELTSLEPDAKFSPSQSAGKCDLPYTKSNTALGAALDADVASLRADGSVKTILDKFGLTADANFTDPTA